MNYRFRIALHDTDTAGVIFFGHLFRHLHDAYEAWMETLGFPIDDLIRAGDFALPIVHTEANYRRPMRHGDWIEIAVSLETLEPTGFGMVYRCLTPTAELAAIGRTLHRCIDPRQGQCVALPTALTDALSAQLPPGDSPSASKTS